MPDEDKTTNTNQPIIDNPTAPTTPAVNTPIGNSGQQANTPPPMVDGAYSPPPPIVEEAKSEIPSTAPVPETEKATQDIPNIPPVITTSGGGRKKPVGKKMIATILGVLVLVGGVGAGVILVQNQQDIREDAREEGGGYIAPSKPDPAPADQPPYDRPSYDQPPYDRPSYDQPPYDRPSYDQPSYDQPSYDRPPYDRPSYDPAPAVPAPKTAPTPTEYSTCNDIGGSCISVDNCPHECWNDGTTDCSRPDMTCCDCESTVTTPLTAKTTLPPGVDCNCLTIKAFDAEWNVITNLSSLVADDVVRFTVSGKTNSGAIDKARFTINGTLKSEVTAKRPSTNEFYDEYTIPEDVSTFTINAELHHTSIGWF